MPNQNHTLLIKILINNTDQTHKLINHINVLEVHENGTLASSLIMILHSITLCSLQKILKQGDMIELYFANILDINIEKNTHTYVELDRLYLYLIEPNESNKTVKLTFRPIKLSVDINIKKNYDLDSINFHSKPLTYILNIVSCFLDLDTAACIDPIFSDFLIKSQDVGKEQYSNYLNMLTQLGLYCDASVYIKKGQLFFIKKHVSIPNKNLKMNALYSHTKLNSKQSKYKGIKYIYKNKIKQLETLTKGEENYYVIFASNPDIHDLNVLLDSNYRQVISKQNHIEIDLPYFQECYLDNEIVFDKPQFQLSKETHPRFFITNIKYIFDSQTIKTYITAIEDYHIT